MESSAAVGSLKRNSSGRVSEFSLTVRVVVTSSAVIPLDHKVSDALLVNSTSLLGLNSISWLTPHLTIAFASFCNIAQAGGGQGEYCVVVLLLLLFCYVVRCRLF
jgi:hypothetical protein